MTRPLKRPQAQPYRKGKARQAGMALTRMLEGKPAFRPHPSQAKRRLRKRRGRAYPK